MQIYWSLKRVPELRGLSTAERIQVHRACYSQNFVGKRPFIAAMLACGVCSALGVAAGHCLPLLFGFPDSIWHAGAGAAVGGGVGGFIFTEISLHQLRPFYATYIQNNLPSSR